MKKQLQVSVVLVALVLLSTGVAWAKKGKGGGPQMPPTVTAEQAKATVSAAIPKLTAGKPYTKQGKQGDIKLEVPVLLDNQVVAKVRLNPATGEILTQGQKSFVQKLSVTPEQAAKTVQGVLREMQAGPPGWTSRANGRCRSCIKGRSSPPSASTAKTATSCPIGRPRKMLPCLGAKVIVYG